MAGSEHEQVLLEVFGFERFRAGQRPAIEHVIDGGDAVVLLPTGGGKSLCYQVPAITLARRDRALAIVISPLIALMGDQVRALRSRGVSAAALNSHQSDEESSAVFRALRAGQLDLLYVSPERAAAPSFRTMIARQRVCLIAVDEAHCVSQWGHDFRPEYLQLAELRDLCSAPMVAATATATPAVLDEIIRHLCLRDPHVERGDFRRHNLRFSVEPIRAHSARQARLVEWIERLGLRSGGAVGRSIVYCSTRKKTDEVAKFLSARGLSCAAYHAGRPREERRRAQRGFEMGRLKVLVATSAFGMGIDIPDVRLIVHYQTPGSLEAYYQEAGRAGRDGLPASCVMFFGTSDLATQRRIVSGGRANESLRKIEAYACSYTCRQQVICEHFGMGEVEACGCCDVCEGAIAVEAVAETVEAASLSQDEVELILSAVGGLSKPVGKVGLARALRGSRAASLHKCGLMELTEHGALRHHDEKTIVSAIESCIELGQLVRKGHKYPTVWLAGKPVRSTHPRERSGANGEASKREVRTRRPQGSYTAVTKALDAFRRRKARELGWKPYMVLQKRTIVALDEQRPSDVWDLQRIPGLGDAKIERFGEELLSIVNGHS